jgi:hypothetical protein
MGFRSGAKVSQSAFKGSGIGSILCPLQSANVARARSSTSARMVFVNFW